MKELPLKPKYHFSYLGSYAWTTHITSCNFYKRVVILVLKIELTLHTRPVTRKEGLEKKHKEKYESYLLIRLDNYR